MKVSIRSFLLINLLLSVTLITSLAIIGNLYLAHRDIQHQLDLDLVQVTHRVAAMMSGVNETRAFKSIQKRLDKTLESNSGNCQDKLDTCKKIQRSTAFQVWMDDGFLALKSNNAPKKPLTDGTDGLSSQSIAGSYWRANTFYDHQTGFTIMVAEQAHYREQLENQLTQDSVLIMLVTYPFLGLLIWIIVGRGLESLKQIAREVDERAPHSLRPVDASEAPIEVAPIIRALNHLFGSLSDAFSREKRFAGDAAHELRTPMAQLSAHAQAALRTESEEERQQALSSIVAGVTRGTHIVQQLLTLSRMVPDAAINDPKPTDLAHEVTEVTALLATQAIDKNTDIELIYDEKDRPIIFANSTAIGILARNLIDNAIRYSPPNSEVRITIERQLNHIVLSVIDNGPGIADDMKERIFERFYRVLGSNESGSGLGLSIVHQIAKLHDADIRLDNPDSGRGLAFRVVFKAYRAKNK